MTELFQRLFTSVNGEGYKLEAFDGSDELVIRLTGQTEGDVAAAYMPTEEKERFAEWLNPDSRLKLFLPDDFLSVLGRVCRNEKKKYNDRVVLRMAYKIFKDRFKE